MAANADKLVRSTVRIEGMENGAVTHTGSGVLMMYYPDVDDQRFLPIVVTNRHVVEGTSELMFRIKGERDFVTIVPTRAAVYHPNPDVDLCALPVADQLLKVAGERKFEFISSRDIFSDDALEQLTAIESIVMIGYPNGLIDGGDLYPISRKGITATPAFAKLDGRPEFMIDCACFPGSSGSPVFIFDQGLYVDKNNSPQIGGHRFGLLGLLYAGPLLNQQGKIVAHAPPAKLKDMVEVPLMLNLGYCVRASEVHKMLEPMMKVAKHMN